MKFFVDGANIDEIKDLQAMGLVDGVTTNPSIIAASGQNIYHVLASIAAIVPGPISAEVVATDAENMLREAESFLKIGPQIAIKVPLTRDGLEACYKLSQRGVMVNVTLCFSASQALLASKAGATFISPFVGRLDDIGHDGMDLIQSIVQMYAQDPTTKTEVLVASVRHPRHIIDAALLGAEVVTAPASVYKKMLEHPLTKNGINAFLKDWEKTGQTLA